MMADFRALCAELTAWAEKTSAHYFQPPDVLLRARAALADEPAVPEGREPASVVQEPSDAELVGKLVEAANGAAAVGWDHHAQRILRAAELLQRQVPVPVPVSERLPEPSTKVLAHYFNDLGRKRTICAIWVPAKSRSGDIGDDDDFTEYDEEDDKFYWPEGWYEAIENWDDLGWIHVDEGEVVYWQPLPKWPAHALPLPEVGE
jgi:hypothetical protein